MSAPASLVALVEASRERKLAELRRQANEVAIAAWQTYAGKHWSEIPAGGPGSMFESACVVVGRKYPRSVGKIGSVMVRVTRDGKWELMAIVGDPESVRESEFTGDGCVWSVILTEADVAEVFGPSPAPCDHSGVMILKGGPHGTCPRCKKQLAEGEVP